MVGLGSPKFDGDDLYWQESRPTEGGRQVRLLPFSLLPWLPVPFLSSRARPSPLTAFENPPRKAAPYAAKSIRSDKTRDADGGGGQVIVKRDAAGTVTDMTPSGFNVRTRVHEYGGGAYTVAQVLRTLRVAPAFGLLCCGLRSVADAHPGPDADLADADAARACAVRDSSEDRT